MLSHRLVQRVTEVREKGILKYLGPDCKSQVTIEYEDDKPVRVDAVVLACQHTEEILDKTGKKITDKARQEMQQSSVPGGFTTTWLASSGDSVDAAIAQIVQASLKELGITMKIQNVDASAQHDLTTNLNYEISHSYWTNDLADPDELAQYALDPASGGHSFNTGFDDKTLTGLVHKAEQEFDKTKRQALYNQIQQLAAESAFLAFLFYVPFPYSRSADVKNFKVLPTGYYHLEDVSL